MPDHSGLRGTDVGQDSRFKDKEAASIKATKFPANFSEKVDLRKVNLSVLKPWIAKRVIELIRVDDDIVVEFVFSMLEDKSSPVPDPKKMQVSLLGFMDKYGAAAFMEELWGLLLSAQSSTGGIPASFLQAKKAEIQKRQATDAQPHGSDVIRMGAMIPAGRPGAAEMFDQKPRDFGPPGRQGPGRDGDRRGDRDRDNGYGGRGPPGRYDDRPPPGRGGHDRGRDNGYGNRGPPRRSPSPRRDRGRDDRGPPPRERGGRDDYDRQRRPTPPRRPSPPPRRRSPSPPPRRRSPSPPPRRRARDSDTPPARKRGTFPAKEKAGISRRGKGRDDTPPLRRRSPSRSPSPPRRRRDRSASRTPTPSDPRGRSRSPTVTPPRKKRDDSTPPRKRREDSTPPRKRRDGSTPLRKRRSPSRSASVSPPPRKRRYDSSPSPPPKERREREEARGGESKRAENDRKLKKKLEGALGKSKWANDE